MSFTPTQFLAASMACAALAFLLHRLHRAMRENRFLPLSPEMKGTLSSLRPDGRKGSEPFVDLHHARSVQRALMSPFLLSWIWVLGLAAFALTAVALKTLVAA